eukprot:1511554-Pyramimonas_sp.AAC.2
MTSRAARCIVLRGELATQPPRTQIFHIIVEGLGGFQVHYGKWLREGEEEQVDFNKIAAGYNFMRKMRTSSNNEGQYAEW